MSSLIQLLATGGVPLVALIVFLDQIGLPAPGMPALVVAGALGHQGRISAGHVLLASLACTVVADGVWYALGRRLGSRALQLVGKLSAPPETLVGTESVMGRFGAPALLFAKFVPGFSTVSVPLAGASGMPFGTFLLFDTAGAVLWAGSGIVIGEVFHRQVEEVLSVLSLLSRGAVVLAAMLAIYVLWRFVKSRRLAPYLLRRVSPNGIWKGTT